MLCVDLGCGPHKPEGYIGVDIYPGEKVDIVADLTQRFPFEDNSVDRLRAYDLIEHLPDRLHTMNEIWRVCKPGAIVDLYVPSTDGRGAFQDPTHISYWNINSFLYYSIDSPLYLELCHRYGFQGAFKVMSLQNEEHADYVVHVKAILKTIKFNSDYHWHSDLQKEILEANYSKIVDFYEKQVEYYPDELKNYYLLGLAYLLNNQEDEAQSTWFWVVSQEKCSHDTTQELITILLAEAKWQEDFDLEKCRIIRRYIYEFAPELSENLMQLTLISADLGQLSLRDIEDWNLESSIKSNVFESQDPILVAKIEAEIARLYFNNQEVEASKALESSNFEVHPIVDRFEFPYKLNLGCGNVKFKGWINIDSDPTLNSIDLVWDVGNQLPFQDASCRFIYNEHMLEHLPVEQGVKLLKECYRVLIPGGILRVAMPSLDILLEKAVSENWRAQDWLSWPQFQFIQTRAEMINISFRWWGHQWLYDREELHRRFREAGFTRIDDVEWSCSNSPELTNRETRQDSLLICEAIKS